MIEAEVGRPLRLRHEPRPAGDVLRTGGTSAHLHDLTGWNPRHSLRDGIAQEVAWLREHLRGSLASDPVSK
jgi:nucleoside-diphosphate-sugar epimerase